MFEKLNAIKNTVEGEQDPEVLRLALKEMLKQYDNLHQRLGDLEQNGVDSEVVTEKIDRLEAIRFSITELTERMERSYIVSSELQAIKEVLDVLSETGQCNSIILEGEPGTGKTQWTYSEVGQELKEGNETSLIHIRVKDTMRAQDLLYEVDNVRRLSDAQASAILPEEIKKEAQEWNKKIISGAVSPADEGFVTFKEKMNAVVELSETAKDLDYMNYINLGPLGEAIYQSSKGEKVYLLIDEIEKGREELMTGMLDEIENLQFVINETGTVVKGDKSNLRIVITTNTEDSDKIPPSFRRRSLYHFVEYPKRDDLAEIVRLNFDSLDDKLLDYALDVFYTYHEHSDIEKKPSTPELLAWIRVLLKTTGEEIPEGIPHKEILLKYQEDQQVEIGSLSSGLGKNREQQSFAVENQYYKALDGQPVFKIVSDINEHYANDNGRYEEFYTRLHRAGVTYYTPQFREEEESDGYGDYSTVQKLENELQIVEPGVEYLGNGYYVIPKDKQALFEGVLENKLTLISGCDLDSVKSKGKGFAKGSYNYDGSDYDAVMFDGGNVVIEQRI